MARQSDIKGRRRAAAEAADAAPRARWRPRRSLVWALVFMGLIAAWMLSGNLPGGGRQASEARTTPIAAEAPDKPPARARVRVRTFSAEPRAAVLSIRGRTEADARVEVRAETAAAVAALPAAKGARVGKGDVLCRLETGARQAALHEAQAHLAQAQADHEASQQLAERGHGAKLKVAADKARLDAARAMVERAELELARTEIRAPFGGIVEDLPAKPGSYLAVGAACAKLVALDPLTVVGSVSERDVGRLRTGLDASASLVTGEKVSGKVTFIAPAADTRTRTFRIEVEIANPDASLRDGVTTDLHIPVASEMAHRISAAILGLDDAGRVGVRAVADGGTVRFMPVTILSGSDDGVWVTGLPETVTLITVGQDYVVDGQAVETVPHTGVAAQ